MSEKQKEPQFNSEPAEQAITASDAGEKLTTTEQVLERLQTLEPEEQEDFFSAWLDRTVPGRVTATFRDVSEAVRHGADESSMALLLHSESESIKDYVSRETEGKLTAEELSTREALATIFPNEWPFVKAK
jgi:hypothetical protein